MTLEVLAILFEKALTSLGESVCMLAAWAHCEGSPVTHKGDCF